MGIRNLTTFMNVHYKKWKIVKHWPRGTRMIIDGGGLLYEMYSKADWINGGQYCWFRKQLLKFFQCLERSNISPIVILDGCDYKGEKEQELKHRMTKSIITIKDTLTDDKHSKRDCYILPVLAQKVLICVLEELNIPFYIADGEADPVIVAMANHYHCPVVGKDSDYFIFNIECGYIPFNKLCWETQPITAELYRLSDFLKEFKIADVRLSRVIPSILGNDFITTLMQNFIDEGVISPTWGYEVPSLVWYISKVENIDKLISHIEKTLSSGISDKLLKNIEKAEKIYDILCTISEEELADVENTALTPSALGCCRIPDWIIAQYRRGHFDRSIMQGLVTGKCYCSIVVDDPDKPSAQLASRRIRQSIFTILNPLMKESTITETFRCGDALGSEDMICQKPNLPSIHSVPNLPKANKIEVLCHVVGVDPKVLESFDDKWKLVVAAGCYWVRECSPGEHIMSSLILCLALCSQSHDITRWLSPRFVYQRDRDSKWMNALHQFSSFQCIYLDVARLNNVLMNPLLFVSPVVLFDGQLAQFFATCEKDLVGLIEKGLRCSPLFANLYQTLSSF